MTPKNVDALCDIERLNEIAELGLLSDEADSVLDEAVRQACARFDVPIALVSIVLDDSQHFAAQHGLSGWLEEANGSPVEWSFCQHVVRKRAPLVVEDATKNELVKRSPLVEVDGIRCYAGIPLLSSRGFALGSLCVIGTEARSFSADELAQLHVLAKAVVRRIEERAGRVVD